MSPTPEWLFPPRGENAEGGDVLKEPFSAEEIVQKFRRMKNTAPGIDGLSYSNWRWVDPKGLILAGIYNNCRTNSRVPSLWKHSTVTLIHRGGGEPAEMRNWRPISLQLTIYKLYAAIIARQIPSWTTATSSSPAQKGFLALDGCAEHNFLLRSMLTDSQRRRRNLILAWLDIREAFPSVSHHLMLFLMERFGLSGSVLQVVQDISTANPAVRTGTAGNPTPHPPPPSPRGVESSRGALSVPSFKHRAGGSCATCPPVRQGGIHWLRTRSMCLPMLMTSV